MCVNNNKKVHLPRLMGLTSSLFLMMLLIFYFPGHAYAAESLSVKEINYVNSTITLQLNSGDSQVYFSDSSKKTWEEVPGTITGSTITMDISWVTNTKNYVMNFKGSSSTAITSVTIPKQATNFKATYNKVKGTVSFSNYGTRTIEWRKKGSTLWNMVDVNTISNELNALCTNGATVYFRLAPLNGTGITDVGFRPSKEITITIPKKATAPSVTINGSAFSIAVKKGMSYRIVDDDNPTSDWTSVNANTSLLLSNIVPNVLYQNPAATQSEAILQFRSNASSTAQISKISTVTIPVQEGPPNLDTYGIAVSYTSSTSLSLQVKSASTSMPFEYTIVAEGKELNYQTAAWTAISSGTAVTLSGTAAKKGSHIYVRKKSVGTSGSEAFALASAAVDVSGTGGVIYPDSPTASTLTTLITTAGTCKTAKSSSYLSFTLYSATSTTVSGISFLDTYGVDKGSVSIKSTVAKNSGSTGVNDKYIITTKITSTEAVDQVTEELLYGKITLANSDVITSTATTGVQLYLYPATKVNNPTYDPTGEYTSSFKRMYLSNDTNDKNSFKFRLDLGTAYAIDPTGINKFTSTPTAISTLKLDGYTLNAGTDYTVEYGSYVNTEETTITTATVTVNVGGFEASSLIDITDTAIPLEISINNGELLDESVSITLINTATLKDKPIAWSITEGSLQETKTTIVTNPDNTTTTVKEEVITYILELSVFDRTYGVSIADVTWGGTSVFGSADITGGTATIRLSNAKINKLATDSTTTNNIVITLSNGFSIKTGCKLTILNAS